MIFIFFSIKKIIIPCSYWSPLSHLTSCTPTKYNLYLANSLAAAASETALYRLLTFHVPGLMSLFCCLGRTKVSVQVRGVFMFRNKASFYWEKMSTPRPTPKLEDHPLLVVRDYCLFSIFAATLRIGGRLSIRNLRTRHAMVTGSIFYYSPQIFKSPNNFNVMSVCTLLVSCLNLSPFCLSNVVFAMAILDLI